MNRANIVEIITAGRNLAAIGKDIRTADFEEVLSKDEPFTVFAPAAAASIVQISILTIASATA